MEMTFQKIPVWSIRAGRESSRPPRKDLFSRPVVLLADSVQQASSLLKKLGRDLTGVIIVPGEETTWTREAELLWRVTAPPEKEDAILETAEFTGWLMTQLERERNTTMRLQAESQYLQREGAQVRKDYAATVERLQLRAQEAAELTRMMEDIQEKERTSIGQKMHDELGQYLTAIRIKAFSIKQGMEEASGKEAGELDGIMELTDHVASWIHDLIRRLNPVRIKGVGLEQMLGNLAERFAAQFGTRVKLNYTLKEPVIEGVAAEQVYYIAQEAMHNAVRHGEATSITLSVKRSRGRNALLAVENNGSAFDVSRVKDGMGLAIMKQRVGLLNGVLEIVSKPEGGTRLSCRFSPIDQPVSHEANPKETHT